MSSDNGVAGETANSYIYIYTLYYKECGIKTDKIFLAHGRDKAGKT